MQKIYLSRCSCVSGYLCQHRLSAPCNLSFEVIASWIHFRLADLWHHRHISCIIVTVGDGRVARCGPSKIFMTVSSEDDFGAT